MEPRRLRIGIYGMGAIGSLLCSKFAPFASMYAIIKDSQQLDGISIDGGPICETISNPLQRANNEIVVMTPDQQLEKPLDIVLISVKATSTTQVGQQLQNVNWINDKSILITLQNGIGNREVLAEALPSNRIFQGITYMGGTLVAPGVVRTGGAGRTILCGSTDVESEFTRLKHIFESAELECALVEPKSIESIVWSKLIVNAAINPLAAILNGPNSSTINSKYAENVMKSIIEETLQVTQAHDIALTFSPEEAIQAVHKVAFDTGDNICSMVTDLRNGKKTEIGVINQAIVQYGENVKIATPCNQLMVDLIHGLEKQLKCK